MDAILSHSLAGAVGAVPTFLGAVGMFIRSRAKQQQKITDAVLASIGTTRKDMEQTKQLAHDALEMARDSNNRERACEKRCDALQGELNQLRREVHSGHHPRGGE